MTRFGLLVPHFGLEADQDLLVEGAQLAESLGFDSLWVRDHLVFHPHGMEGTDRTFIEPLITLTYLAGKTEKIGLGAATIIPFRHPILMAYSVASMSWITRRRFDLGIGAGTFDHEFEVIGQGAEDRVQMMKEQVLIARRLWSGETIEWQSERYKFSDVDLKPRPLSPVPVWWATYAARVRKIRQMAEEQGKPMILTGAVPVTSIDTTTKSAVDRLNVPGLIKNANAQKFWLKPPSGEFTKIEELDGSILAGTPEDIVRGVQRYQELGCDLLIFDFRMRFPDYLDQIKTLARDVLPLVSGARAGATAR
ncbi:MAG: LLM class flavin-dependent oxidoreductase [Chloroflexi bacterium]|nr:MAG: LLM class flavin-dependent oxidoreductase [Chloroflexota bacterium]